MIVKYTSKTHVDFWKIRKYDVNHGKEPCGYRNYGNRAYAKGAAWYSHSRRYIEPDERA